MKVGDLVRFPATGRFADVIEVSKDFGGYAVLWVHGWNPPAVVDFKNPTHISLDMLKRTSELINESR
tara:strand:- start:1899 stop:2099 length:201 start_codon:yes stop_codon:yes gene_type:complete